MATIVQLQSAGFTDEEIQGHVSTKSQSFLQAGFSQEEIDTHFGISAQTPQIAPESTPRTFGGEFANALKRGGLNVLVGVTGTIAEFQRPPEDIGSQQSNLGVISEIISKKLKTILAEPVLTPTKLEGLKGKQKAGLFVANAVGEALPFTLATVAAALLGGPAAAGVVAFSVEGEQAFQEAIDAGATRTEANIERVVVGTINSALELLQVDEIVKFSGVGKTSVRAIVKAAKDKSLKKIAKESGKLTLAGLKSSIKEGVQEALQETTSVLAPKITGRDTVPLNEAIQRIGQSFLGGAVVGPILSGGVSVFQGEGGVQVIDKEVADNIQNRVEEFAKQNPNRDVIQDESVLESIIQEATGKPDISPITGKPVVPVSPEVAAELTAKPEAITEGKGLAETKERGKEFKTGKPVTFEFIRNTEKAPDMGSRFQQDIEPAGRFMQTKPSTFKEGIPNLVSGEITFESPLVIEFNTGTEKTAFDENNWKARLSESFDNKTGIELSKAIRGAGFDGIVTIGQHGETTEIVDLTGIKPPAEAVTEGKVGPEFLFHGTTQGAALNIQREGLKTKVVAKGVEQVSLSENILTAESFANRKSPGREVLLRIKKTPAITVDERIVPRKGKLDFKSLNDIPIKNIEVRTPDGKWIPLRQFDLITKEVITPAPTAEEGKVIVPEQIGEGKPFKPVSKKGPGLTKAERETLTTEQQQKLRFKQTEGERVGFKVGQKAAREEGRRKIKEFQLASKLTDKNRADALDVVREFVPKEKQSVFTKRILQAKTSKRVDRITQAIELFIEKAEKKAVVNEFKTFLSKTNKEFRRGEVRLGKLPSDIRDRVLSIVDEFDPAKLSETKRRQLESRDRFIKRVSGTVANAFESLEESAVDILQIPSARVQELQRLSKAHIGSLSTEQVRYINASLDHLIQIAKKRGESKERARSERVAKQVNTARQEVSQKGKEEGVIELPKGVAGHFGKVFVQGQSSIRTMTGRATSKENKATMDLLVEKIQNAKRDEHAIIKEFSEASTKAIDKELDFTEKDSAKFDELVSIKLGGKAFKIDIDNLFSVYMAIKADGNLRQLLKTKGLNIVVIKRNPKLLNIIKSKKRIITGTPQLSELREVVKIIEAIPKFKELAETTFRLNKDVVSPKVNETSIAFQNFPLARKDKYWPQPRVTALSIEGKSTDVSVAIEQQGMFLPKKGGTAPLLIRPYRSQFVNILQTSAQFSASTLPMRDAKSLLGDKKWQDKMRKMGRGAELKGIITMFRRMQGLSTDKAFVDLAGAKLLNNFGKSVLSLRLSGYGVQVASVPAAYEFIEPKHFKTTEKIRKAAIIPKKDIQEMTDLSPTLWVRWKAKQFNYVTGGVAAQHSFNNMILGKTPLLDKFLNQYTWGDQKAIKMIFDAAQNKVATEQGLKKGTNENKEAAIKETERALETQPNWDIIYRSPLTSSPNVFLRGSLMFQAARNAQMNVLMRSIDDFSKDRISAGEAGRRMSGVLLANISVAIVKRLLKFGIKASIFGLIFILGDEEEKEAAVGAIAKEGLKDVSRLPQDTVINLIGLPAFGNIPAAIANETLRSFKKPASTFRKLADIRTGNFFADLTLDATSIGVSAGALGKHLLTQEKISSGPRRGRLKWRDDAENVSLGIAELIAIRYGLPLAAPKQELFFQTKAALRAVEPKKTQRTVIQSTGK